MRPPLGTPFGEPEGGDLSPRTPSASLRPEVLRRGGRPVLAKEGRKHSFGSLLCEALLRTLRAQHCEALQADSEGPLLLGAIAHKQKWSPASPRGDTSRPEALIRLTYPSVALPPHKTFAASSLSGGVRRPRAPGKEALRRRPSRARQGRKHSFGSLL
jgi:hypothetical protein